MSMLRAPSKMVYRAIRGMMQHKAAFAQAALERLKVGLYLPTIQSSQEFVGKAAQTALKMLPSGRGTVRHHSRGA